MHVAVVGDLVAAADDLADEVRVGLGDIAGDVETTLDVVRVEEIKYAGVATLGPYSAMDIMLG